MSEYESMKVADLQEELKKRGVMDAKVLKSKKADLIEKLISLDSSNESVGSADVVKEPVAAPTLAPVLASTAAPPAPAPAPAPAPELPARPSTSPVERAQSSPADISRIPSHNEDGNAPERDRETRREPEANGDGCKLFVANLPPNSDDRDLEDMFSKYGKLVSAAVAKDRSSGRTKGYGFVVFEESQDAKDAINALHDTEVDGGKRLKVELSTGVPKRRERDPREPRSNVCYAWRDGRCNRGRSCRFDHFEEGTRGGGGGRGGRFRSPSRSRSRSRDRRDSYRRDSYRRSRSRSRDRSRSRSRDRR